MPTFHVQIQQEATYRLTVEAPDADTAQEEVEERIGHGYDGFTLIEFDRSTTVRQQA